MAMNAAAAGPLLALLEIGTETDADGNPPLRLRTAVGLIFCSAPRQPNLLKAEPQHRC
jgi:hypothetical protein